MRTIVLRLVQVVPILFIVSVATFLLVDFLPGDPALAMLGENATPQTTAALHEQLGLNDPLPVRYVRWAGDALSGDLGTSIRSNRPVTAEFMERLPVTLELTVLAMGMALLLAIPLGTWSAYRAGRAFDRLTSGVSFGLVSLPSFLLALLLVYFFALRLEVFPVTGWERISDGLGPNLRTAFLPALALAATQLAIYTQLLRTDMVATLNEDFVLAARAKGLPNRSVLLRHALKPSSFSLVTLAGVNFGTLLGGTLIIEQLFGLPGVGRLLIQSIPSKDMPVIQGSVLMLAVAYLLINLFVDLSYALLDPRTRHAAN